MKKCPWCGHEYPDQASVSAIDQSPLQPRDPVPSAGVSQLKESSGAGRESIETAGQEEEVKITAAPDGFRAMGAFDAFEANPLLKRFLDADIRFQIDTIERRERSGSSNYRTVGYVQIFIHTDDYEKADQIRTADWKV